MDVLKSDYYRPDQSRIWMNRNIGCIEIIIKAILDGIIQKMNRNIGCIEMRQRHRGGGKNSDEP